MNMANHSSVYGLSHGMSANLVASDWPKLTLTEAARVLRHYPQTGKPLRITWHSPRPFSAGCVVTTTNVDIFIKRHHINVRTVDELSEEHLFISYLRTRGISVCEALSTSNGATAINDGHWTYEVQFLATGVDLYQDAASWTPFRTTAHAYAAGRSLAHLHIAASGYDAPPRHSRTLLSGFTIFSATDPLQQLQHYIAQQPALTAYLAQRDWRADTEAVLLPFHAGLLPFTDLLIPLWTHNDWHASNLLWSDHSDRAAVQTILDFGLCNRVSALYDLATAIERNIIEWLAIPSHAMPIVHIDLLDALLDGYAAIIKLSTRQWQALAAILPLVHAEFALSELAYFQGITHSPHNATLAYDTYYLGHAAWFKGSTGQHLLTHIARKMPH